MKKREQIYDTIEEQLIVSSTDVLATQLTPYLAAILEVLIDLRDLYEVRSA